MLLKLIVTLSRGALNSILAR